MKEIKKGMAVENRRHDCQAFLVRVPGAAMISI